ncbi:MAG: hypothetical protein WCP45_07030, partial [Verrucomicrobiota bacterium]
MKPTHPQPADAQPKAPIVMASEHPFQVLFESFGRLPASHADAVNRPSLLALCEVLSVPLAHAGRGILLRAPRAGHGKTHLLTQAWQSMETGHAFIPLHAVAGTRIDALSVMDDTLRHLERRLPGRGALCGLEALARRLFALALQPLVRSGDVPCLDRDAALDALRQRPLQTLDFHHPQAVTAQWMQGNFEALGPRLSWELAQLTGLPARATGFWVTVLFRFATSAIDHPGRFDALVQTTLGAGPGDGAAIERLATLLALMTVLSRVVLVADELDGCCAETSAGVRLASFLASLGQHAERLDVIVAVNHDVWERVFAPHLSSGLAERLSEVVIELAPLTDAEMLELLESRPPGMG